MFRSSAALCLVAVVLAHYSSGRVHAQAPAPSANADCVMPDHGLLQRFETARAKLQQTTEPRPIYGCDDRKNIYDPAVTDAQKKAARATAILVKTDAFTPKDGGSRFDLKSAGTRLCSPEDAAAAKEPLPERFWDEPNPGFCSGFKVGPRLIATAGHCIKDAAECRTTRFLFGFQMNAPDARPDKDVPKDNVYDCVAIVGGALSGTSDWRVVRVDRDINAPQVDVRTSEANPPLAGGAAVTVVGYPIGLPVKIADDATVRSLQKTRFVANLDTYGGNSGSVVFNGDRLRNGDLLAEGILIAGETDFKNTSKACMVSKRCPSDGCIGETVTSISEIIPALKN